MLYKQLMWTAAFGIIRSWQGAFSTVIGKSSAGCLAILALGLPVHAQQLEALLASSSLNVTQTRATAPVIPMGPVYTLLTDEDRSRTDDIGYRLALAARWQLGKAGFFVQPELAFTNTRGQTYFINHYRVPQFPDRDNFSHRIHRWELAMLVGKHTSRHTYVLAGPVLALNQRQTQSTAAPGSVGAVYNSLFQTVEPVQLLLQAGVGLAVGRFDFNLRLEQSLTPYTRRGTFEGNSYGYEQQIRQGLFTAGFLLYKWRAPAER